MIVSSLVNSVKMHAVRQVKPEKKAEGFRAVQLASVNST